MDAPEGGWDILRSLFWVEFYQVRFFLNVVVIFGTGLR